MLGAVSIPAPLQSLFALSWQVQSLSRQAVNITCSCFYSDLLSNVSKCTWTDFKNSQKCFTWLRTWPSTKLPRCWITTNYMKLDWISGEGQQAAPKEKGVNRKRRVRSPQETACLADSSCAEGVGDALLAKWAEWHQWQGHQLSSTHQYFVSLKELFSLLSLVSSSETLQQHLLLQQNRCHNCCL